MTTTVPSRSNQPMHNFSLPFLKWGQRSHVNTSNRCRRLLSHTKTPHRRPSDSDHHNHGKPRNFRPKDKATAIEDASLERENNSSKVSDHDAADGEVKPWNLRPRRSPISNIRVNSYGKGTVQAATPINTMYGRSAEEDEESKRKRKLWISLSKEEIEEDVYALTGSKPARRPKKRNKTVQKQVDNLFPGLYLDGISPDSYRA